MRFAQCGTSSERVCSHRDEARDDGIGRLMRPARWSDLTRGRVARFSNLVNRSTNSTGTAPFELGYLLVKIFLEAGEDLADFFWTPQVGYGVGYGVVVFEL